MPPIVGRIRRQATFRALSRPEGRGQAGPVIVAYRRVEESAGRPLAGYAVGRRHGGAVARNRLRRRLREAVRSAGPELSAGAYLVRSTPGAGELGFEDRCRAVESAATSAARRASELGGQP